MPPGFDPGGQPRATTQQPLSNADIEEMKRAGKDVARVTKQLFDVARQSGRFSRKAPGAEASTSGFTATAPRADLVRHTSPRNKKFGHQRRRHPKLHRSGTRV